MFLQISHSIIQVLIHNGVILVSTSNKGVELGLTGYIIDNKDFTLSANFNIGLNNFKIEKLDGTTERFERSNWASTDLNNINDYQSTSWR